MKLLTVKGLGAAVAITLAGIAGAALLWVVSTTQGSRWLLTAGIQLIGISFSAQKIEGRIADHLLLNNVRITLAEQKLEIGSLELEWKPLLLLAGTLAVQELLIDEVRIQDDTPRDGKPPVLDWPRATEIDRLLDAKIVRLKVTNLGYRRLQEQPVLLNSISGSVNWQNSLLSIDDLKAVSPSGRINGTFSAGFKQASLSGDLAVALTQPVAEMDRFSIQVRPGSSTGSEHIGGSVTVAGSAGTRKLLELAGNAGMSQNADQTGSKRDHNCRRINCIHSTGIGSVVAGQGHRPRSCTRSELTDRSVRNIKFRWNS
jgi:translocation and assembly module TamB